MYRCRVCGYTTLKWLGRCPSCGSWNSFDLVEEDTEKGKHKDLKKNKERAYRADFLGKVYTLSDIEVKPDNRIRTSIEELDRVLGGGIVRGSSVLIAGEPGVGKSTLMLHLASNIASRGYRVLYVSAEESPQQVKMRADRLSLPSQDFKISPLNVVEDIVELLETEHPQVVILDSLQTVMSYQVEGSSGGVAQVRKVASYLNSVAKARGISIFIVGHVTKGGVIAGPKIVEHIVDVVLTFTGDRSSNLRILRARKNRFGSVNETGVFEMTSGGLVAVSDSATLFVNEVETPGSARGIVLEGSRMFVVEVGTLVAPSQLKYPKRMSRGFDPARLYMLSAVLERHAGLRLSNRDVLASVVSGFRVNDPAFDLAVVAAIISSVYDKIIPADFAFSAEVSLTGVLRRPHRLEERRKIASRVGVSKFVYPSTSLKNVADFLAFLKREVFSK